MFSTNLLLVFFYEPEEIPCESTKLMQQKETVHQIQSKNGCIQNEKLQTSQLFWEEFAKELEIMNSRYQKKIWTDQEDLLLLNLRNADLGWRDISKLIYGTSDQIFKRRYFRLQFKCKKWPKELDNQIKHYVQVENKSWEEIYNILKKEKVVLNKQKFKKIQKRYELHLKTDISNKAWAPSEDFNLLHFVFHYGKKWKKLSQIFKTRTELQLKNRYYGTLIPIKKRVLRNIRNLEQN